MWIGDWTDQEGGGCKLSPQAQRKECGQGFCNASRGLAACCSPRPLLTVLCDCSVVVWHPKVLSHGAEQKRSTGGEMVLAQGRRQVSGEQALLR